jgi:hypothetical protein
MLLCENKDEAPRHSAHLQQASKDRFLIAWQTVLPSAELARQQSSQEQSQW